MILAEFLEIIHDSTRGLVNKLGTSYNRLLFFPGERKPAPGASDKKD